MVSITKHFKDKMHLGDSLKDIFKLWWPELIASAVFIVLSPMLDSYLVGGLKSVATFGALGAANQIIHTLLKFAEAIPVAAMAIIGRHNGAKQFKKCGQDLGDAFWSTVLLGILQFLLIFFGAVTIYKWLGVSDNMMHAGVPFLRLRSFGMFLTFTSLGFLAFMKAIKNTRTPMVISMIGIGIFILFDFLLIPGNCGFPKLGLVGSAIASIIQYSFVIVLSCVYIFLKKDYKKYFSGLFIKYFSFSKIVYLLNLSWPIMIDKTSLALSYVWLTKMVAKMGDAAICSMEVVKNLERAAFLPAIASAVVIVFLVSNRLGAKDPEGANTNIKKVLLFTAILVTITLVVMSLSIGHLSALFDPSGKFSFIVNAAFPFISLLVVFDFIQLILAGSLRGAGDVKSVMKVRFFSCFFFLAPLAYGLSLLPIQSVSIKFCLIYSSFYLNSGMMGIFFLKRIMGKKWQNIKI